MVYDTRSLRSYVFFKEGGFVTFEPTLHQILFRVIKRRGFKQAGHIDCVEDTRKIHKVFVGKINEKYHVSRMVPFL
jgi:hypothetical protein